MQIRPMTLADLDLMLAIQQRCYPEAYHEPAAAFENKLRRAPGSAWLATSGGQAHAYLVALPVDEAHFPALHGADWAPPARAKWLCLHDLAVDPGHRGGGAAQRLVANAFAHAREQGLQGLALVAVQGSQPYWARHGFSARQVVHATLLEKLGSFGDGARFMVCD